MTSFKGYGDHDAVGLEKLIFERQVSATEVLDEALDWSDNGLPVGVHFGDRTAFLQLNAQLEQAAPWAHWAAPIYVG
jgi:hypothetical protein